MTATVRLFPTFGSIWQRAKRLLATDTCELWQRFVDACEADEQRYINECRAKGINPYFF
jgi:hypothetical protein